jgi:Zn-dependent protease with chaperone function
MRFVSIRFILLVSLSIFFLAGCAGPARMDSKAIAAQGGVLKNSKGKTIHSNLPFMREGNANVVIAGDKLRLITGLDTQIDILENKVIDVVSTMMKTGPKRGFSYGQGEKKPRITFHTAFLRYVTYEEDEIAAMIAHQLAHIELGHIRKATGAETTANVAGVAAKQVLKAFIPFGDTLINLAINRSVNPMLIAREEEADRLGFTYLTQAGYNGEAMVSLWTKIRKAEADKAGLFSYLNKAVGFRDGHPPNENRLKYLNELAAKTNIEVQD